MTAGARACGILGTIVPGRVHGTAEHRAVERCLPVGLRRWASSPSRVLQRCRFQSQSMSMRSNTGGIPTLTVNLGDILLADGDGVVCVPKPLEQDILMIATHGGSRRSMSTRHSIGSRLAEAFRRHRGK
jgi:regulator of RNase E activity RraA